MYKLLFAFPLHLSNRSEMFVSSDQFSLPMITPRALIVSKKLAWPCEVKNDQQVRAGRKTCTVGRITWYVSIEESNSFPDEMYVHDACDSSSGETRRSSVRRSKHTNHKSSSNI